MPNNLNNNLFPITMRIIIVILVLFSWQNTFTQINQIDNPILTEKVRVKIGMYFPSETIRISADGNTPNLNIDFQEAFDLNNNETTLFLNFFWRFSNKWLLFTEYFAVKNAKKIALEEDINWKDFTFKKGSNVKGGYGLDLYRIFVGRVISKGEKHDFGAGIGVHAMQANAFIQGNAYINDEDFGFKNSTVSTTIPLPNIGMWYFYAPHSKWSVIGRLDWFALSIGEYSGSLWNLGPSISYQITKNFSLAAGYRFFKASAKVDKPEWDGKFSMTFKGPLVSIVGSF